MDNVIEQKSFQFAIQSVQLYKYLSVQKKEFVLSKQLLRSGTSIGANIAEAQQAQSRADFVSKMSIALKETTETKYWLRLLYYTEYIEKDCFDSIFFHCVEIEKILVSILKTAKNQ